MKSLSLLCLPVPLAEGTGGQCLHIGTPRTLSHTLTLKQQQVQVNNRQQAPFGNRGVQARILPAIAGSASTKVATDIEGGHPLVGKRPSRLEGSPLLDSKERFTMGKEDVVVFSRQVGAEYPVRWTTRNLKSYSSPAPHRFDRLLLLINIKRIAHLWPILSLSLCARRSDSSSD